MASSRLGDITGASRGLKAPEPETAELPAASGLGFCVPDGIRTRYCIFGSQPQVFMLPTVLLGHVPPELVLHTQPEALASAW